MKEMTIEQFRKLSHRQYLNFLARFAKEQQMRNKIAHANYTEIDSSMSNEIAYRLGVIAYKAGQPRKDIGDSIDRGLVLYKLLHKKGFMLGIREK